MNEMLKETVLAVDDEPNNLRIIEMELEDHGYNVLTAEDGVQAWQVLQENGTQVSTILLDRMMPNMDGMELLKKIKSDENLCQIPVIMQTAAAEKEQISEGISAGAYYYLAKPYDEDMMVSIVKAALSDYKQIRNLKNKIELPQKVNSLMVSAEYIVHTLDEAKNIAAFLATLFPNPDRVLLGLTELILNGLEHGNLGVTYDEKTALMQEGKWEEEVVKRQLLPDNVNKVVRINFERSDEAIQIKIEDEGEGFEWRNYLEISTERMTHSHGRGVAMANLTSFDHMQYNDKGNSVTCRVNL